MAVTNGTHTVPGSDSYGSVVTTLRALLLLTSQEHVRSSISMLGFWVLFSYSRND